jgi:acyl transferase domain-containing protein
MMSGSGLKSEKLLRQECAADNQSGREGFNFDVAIIGMSGCFPDASSPDHFWNNLCAGKCSIKEFPQNRITDVKEYLDREGKTNAKFARGAYLERIDQFDNEFFKLTPREAGLMSPFQRLFLEQAWKAIEDSGYGGQRLSGTNTGVYLGLIGDIEGYKYLQMLSRFFPNNELRIAMAGNLTSIIPGRIAYTLNLRGPCMIIDTACSSSLTAVHAACAAIKNGGCDQAIAAGIRLSFLPFADSIKIGIEAHDGLTRAFDDASDGTGAGEGIGVVFLKALPKAEDDGDRILAVIKGSALNQDGTTMGITAPNPLAQMQVIKKAWENSGINPETISYIEAHGTGTPLGDSIEIDGLTKAFREYTDKRQFCGIGSVKTNIGHLYEAAGIASLIKMILCLKNQQLPPSLHFKVPNEKIDFLDSPLYVVNSLCDWEKAEFPRRAGISSFGFSGTNCHLVVEEYIPKDDTVEPEANVREIFTLSAKKKCLLMESIQRHLHFFATNRNLKLRDVCYTANTGRGHYERRVALIVESIADLINKLDSLNEFSHANSEGIYCGFPESGGLATPSGLQKNLTAQAAELLDRESVGESQREKLCDLYVKGADIDWRQLYQNEKRKKIGLPSYCFEQKKTWFNCNDATISKN